MDGDAGRSDFTVLKSMPPTPKYSMAVPFDQALELVLSGVSPMAEEDVELHRAAGRTLARDLHSDRSIPSDRISAMDGYALPDDGSSPCGYSESTTAGNGKPRTCRVLTGQPVPEWAYCVAAEEQCSRNERNDIFLTATYPHSTNIREEGEDARPGELLLRAGALMDAASLARAASAGYGRLKVLKKPRIAILTSGDELVRVNETQTPAYRYESNGIMLSALTDEAGGNPVLLPHLPDIAFEIESAVTSLDDYDLIITSGGASNSEKDLIRPIFKRSGAAFLFERVKMKPGRPTGFALKGKQPVFVLPGNPVASFVSFAAFVRPAIHAMLRRNEKSGSPVQARLQTGFQPDPDRHILLRATTKCINGELIAEPFPETGSGLIRSLAATNSILSIPPGNHIEPGTTVKIIWIRREYENRIF